VHGFNIYITLLPLSKERHIILKMYAHIFTQPQGTEHANKDMNRVALYGRNEEPVLSRLTATSWLGEQCCSAIIGEKEQNTMARGISND
jgi:hypothetical protein